MKKKQKKTLRARAKHYMPINVHLDSKMVSLASPCTLAGFDELFLTQLYEGMELP